MDIEKKISDTINKYRLFTKKDKILVAVSGGKDSTTAICLLKKLGYKVEGITVDALIGNYTRQNLENLKSVCRKHNIKLHEISFREEFGYSLCYLRSVLYSKGHNLNSCAICGALRRYLLNKYSRKLKAKCIVTGHNLDDEAQSLMMNLFRNTLEMSARLGPSSGLIKNKSFIPRVKPLYFCTEKEITQYSKKMKFPVKYGHCPCRTGSFRNEVSIILDRIEKKDPEIKQKIIQNFLRILPKLKQGFKTTEKIKTCSSCGEPAKEQFCQACKIINLVKKT